MLEQLFETNAPSILGNLLDMNKATELRRACESKFKVHPCIWFIDANRPEMLIVWLERIPYDYYVTICLDETLLLYLAK